MKLASGLLTSSSNPWTTLLTATTACRYVLGFKSINCNTHGSWQYMVSTMFVFDRLEATDYTDGSEAATSQLVESLRQRITCIEDPQFTKDYHDPEKRTIANALTVKLRDGTVLEE